MAKTRVEGDIFPTYKVFMSGRSNSVQDKLKKKTTTIKRLKIGPS